MSEYQYYEFQAVDQPLTAEQMRELRALSTRAEITRTSFTNTYDFGDFRGDPNELMKSYFDAHVYVSNFGTFTLMLRLPRTVLSDATVAPYCGECGLTWWTTDEHTILQWQTEEDYRDEWVEGEGWMGRLLPMRDELVRGDYRSLYVGWLYCNASYVLEQGEHSDGWGEEEVVAPPVPAGLGALTASQDALVEFLNVSRDVIAAAAEASPEIPRIPAGGASDEGMSDWVAGLPEEEVRAIIGRVIRGEGLRVQTELQSRYYRAHSEPTASAPTGAENVRTPEQIATRAAEIASARKRQEIEKRNQESKERERKRQEYLASLEPRFSELWATVNRLTDEKKPTSYDKARDLLVDLCAAYGQVGRRLEFDAEFAGYLERYARLTGMIRRLKEAHLTS